jgi:deazaflavin-dependent oxidoreductase (nitroreductase family)
VAGLALRVEAGQPPESTGDGSGRVSRIENLAATSGQPKALITRHVAPGGNRMPTWLPRLNNRIVNPIQRLWAPWIPPYAVVVHRGRKTRVEYRTPVLALRHGENLIIALLYGDQTQWMRNLEAGGGGRIVRRGREHRISSMLVTDGTTDPARVPLRLRRALRNLHLLIVETA